jgi:hypothetical protein
MIDDTLLPFDLPSVRRKKLSVDFDGGNQSSDGGLLLLRAAERKVRDGAFVSMLRSADAQRAILRQLVGQRERG